MNYMNYFSKILISVFTSFQLLVSSFFGHTGVLDSIHNLYAPLGTVRKAAQREITKIYIKGAGYAELNKIKRAIPGSKIEIINNKRYIVINSGISERTVESILGRLGILVGMEPPKNVGLTKPIEKLTPSNGFEIPEISKLNDSAVNDPGYKYEWDISHTEANRAWPLISQKREIRVAVLDTGIDYSQPDLKNRILANLGYNFINNTRTAKDDNGHGTHVSGIIAAEANNGIGITGIAGPLDVKIIPVKVLNSKGEGRTDIIAKGIKYAADEGADIINLSLGSLGSSSDIQEAVDYARNKGVFIVAAAGNDDKNCDNYSPAGDDGVFTVSAVNTNLKRAAFSNYGNSVQAAAPGVRILSTVPGGYQAWSGTSMAAPVVSGIAAMLKAQNPYLTPDQIATLLDSTAQKASGYVKDPGTGYGVVDAYKAVEKLISLEVN